MYALCVWVLLLHCLNRRCRIGNKSEKRMKNKFAAPKLAVATLFANCASANVKCVRDRWPHSDTFLACLFTGSLARSLWWLANTPSFVYTLTALPPRSLVVRISFIRQQYTVRESLRCNASATLYHQFLPATIDKHVQLLRTIELNLAHSRQSRKVCAHDVRLRHF